MNTAFSASFSQPLIRNRGSYINKIGIIIARGNLRQTKAQLRSNILTSVQNAENAYWDVVLAHANLRVQEEALKLAQEALKRSQQELDLGAMSPLDIYNPQQQQATAEICRFAGAVFAGASGVRAAHADRRGPRSRDSQSAHSSDRERRTPPEYQAPINDEAAIQKALRMRPDLEALRIALEVDDLQIEQAANQLRPDLELTGNYTLQGLRWHSSTTLERQRIATHPGRLWRRAHADVRISAIRSTLSA